jgi:hypothetical protein
LGPLEFADRDTIRFRIEGSGHIDVLISPFCMFEYFDPAAQGAMPRAVVELRKLPEPPATGADMVATTPAGESFIFL